MKAFFDTSVMVAVYWRDHPGHAESIARFSNATPHHSFCGLHSLAEVYATTTALPVRNTITPDQAGLFAQDILRHCTLVALTEDEYASTIERAARKGFKSGMIYDALLMRCAEKSKADVIYTWNLKHFRAIAPELADRIRTP
jgi:predicted nucleic acid-binding protein